MPARSPRLRGGRSPGRRCSSRSPSSGSTCSATACATPSIQPGAMTERFDQLVTEAVRPELKEIDRAPTADLVRLMNDEDARVPASVAAAVDAVAERLARGGRLVYVGAGTAGRLGILDAAECGPTFDTDRVVAV